MVRYLSSKVEMLRERMVELAMEKGNLMDEEVVAVSQQLDKELVKLQRLLMNKRKVVKRANVTRAARVGKGDVGVFSFSVALQTPSRKWRSSVSSR